MGNDTRSATWLVYILVTSLRETCENSTVLMTFKDPLLPAIHLDRQLLWETPDAKLDKLRFTPTCLPYTQAAISSLMAGSPAGFNVENVSGHKNILSSLLGVIAKILGTTF
jgi:hypothetical protein